METSALKPYFVVIALLVLTSLALAFTVDVNLTDEAGIKMQLPSRVGEWTGEEVRFCQNPTCQKKFFASALKDRDVCPACGGRLDCMTVPERQLLPGDTQILKYKYTDAIGQVVFVAIVLSGKERASIHRPQVCLVGQGNEIDHSGVMGVPMENRKPLDIMVLDMIRRYRAPDGRQAEFYHYYAYWFVGKGRETSSHIQRMIWMATDRIFHNVSHRWAYIAVTGVRQAGSDDYKKEIQSFVHDLYPQMIPDNG